MATFRTILEAETYVEQQAHEALAIIAEEVLAEWKSIIKKRVYEEGRLKKDPSNQNYKRTGQLLDSLELKWINPLLVELDYNRDKILPSMMLDRHSFNRHASFDGVDWSNAIPHFVELGNGDSKIYAYEGVNAHEDICKMLSQSYQIMLQQALRARGVK